ncbi:hypothetical protein B0H10DRAFT_1938599 [Mycena sp. CBHHK59/15]|nr:hypothetical protein B0H10DRAFT_1938599 [Mycena sp. CBHHK59/15]
MGVDTDVEAGKPLIIRMRITRHLLEGKGMLVLAVVVMRVGWDGVEVAVVVAILRRTMMKKTPMATKKDQMTKKTSMKRNPTHRRVLNPALAEAQAQAAAPPLALGTWTGTKTLSRMAKKPKSHPSTATGGTKGMWSFRCCGVTRMLPGSRCPTSMIAWQWRSSWLTVTWQTQSSYQILFGSVYEPWSYLTKCEEASKWLERLPSKEFPCLARYPVFACFGLAGGKYSPSLQNFIKILARRLKWFARSLPSLYDPTLLAKSPFCFCTQPKPLRWPASRHLIVA